MSTCATSTRASRRATGRRSTTSPSSGCTTRSGSASSINPASTTCQIASRRTSAACGCSSCASRSGRRVKAWSRRRRSPATACTRGARLRSASTPRRSSPLPRSGRGSKTRSTALAGPEKNCFDTDRQGGAYYEDQLRQAVRSGRHILAAETWNEFSEGTDIQETVETGRQYIDLTRRYVDQFKALVGAAP